MSSTHKCKLNLAYIVIAFISVFFVCSCGDANKIVLVEDIQPNISVRIQEPRPIRLQPGDQLNVYVHSRDKELVEMFNVGNTGTGLSGTGSNRSRGIYTVDANGNIEMPIIGSLTVKGLTRTELQDMVKYKLLASKLVRDPIVRVDFVDLQYYTLGEAGYAAHEMTRDQVNLLEAIAEMGGISPEGKHTNVLVLRTIDGKQTPYEVDITNTASLYSSPVFYLQQNDVIYARPTQNKIQSTSLYGNQTRTPYFWLGIFNSILSLTVLFSK